MSSYHTEKQDTTTEFKKYHTFQRMPAAVSCWFPTGEDTDPIITFFKFKEPEGDIITIRTIYDQYCDKHYYFGASTVEFRCHILYMDRKREVVLFYYPRDLRWEMTFLN